MKVNQFLAATVLLVTAEALPMNETDLQLQIFGRGDVHAMTKEVFDNFKLYSQYCTASYCKNNTNSGAKDMFPADSSTPLTCGADSLCPLVQHEKAFKFYEFAPDKKALAPDLRGFIAINLARKETVVSFRGTASFANFLAVLHISKTKLPNFPQCPKCHVHDGFAAAFKERLPEAHNAIKQAQKAYPNNKLVLTGHSLGGAIATLMGVWLREHGFPGIEIWTYGAPRIGNKVWAQFVTNQTGITYRMTHLNDPVPRLPPSFWPFKYTHEGPEFWLGPKGKPATDNYNVSDIKVCNGVESNGCNGGTKIVPISIKAHHHYLGKIDACSTTKRKRDDLERTFLKSEHMENILLAEEGFAEGNLSEMEAFEMVNETMKLSEKEFYALLAF